MSFRWLITDIDGTLLDDAGGLPPRNRAALEHCRRQGIPVVLATGRRWSTLRRLVDRFGLAALADLAIVNNGMRMHALDTGDVVHAESFPAEQKMATLEVLDALGWDPIALSHNPADGVDVHYRRLSLLNGDFVAKNAGCCRTWRESRELRDLEVVELILLGPEEELRRAQMALAPLPLETALIRNTFYAGSMLEITPQGVSKLSGARRAAAWLGLDLAEAVAVGDSANDMPLLRSAGRSIAVANAPAAVRECAQETVAAAAACGVAEAVDRHFAGTVT